MNKILFPKLAWFLFLLVPLAAIGFWPGYFSKITDGLPSIFHIHAFFLTTWIVLAITQPLLIHLKRTKLHKTFGRLSYIIMPMVFAAIYLMIRHSYYHEIERMSGTEIRNKYNLTDAEIYQYAAAYQIKATIDFIWLLLFYALSIINRRKMLPHATYMVAAIFTLLGPTLDRVIAHTLDFFEKPFSGIAEYATFTFILLFFFILMIYQRRKGNSITPAAVCFTVYTLGVAGYKFLPLTKLWQTFIELIM